MGYGRYMVVGWNARFGCWTTELFECMTMNAAKQRFVTQYPTLKQIRVYPLRDK